jgi:AcrR family transcriptional regulator
MASDRVPTERRRRRPTRSGQVLSEELIVQTSMRLIEQHGGEALSMRRLGAALGSDATAIYRYFPSKDELLLAVADELIGRSLELFRPTGNWIGDLRQLAVLVYRRNLAYPRTAVLAASRVTGRPNEIKTVEMMLGIMRGAGFDDAEAVRHYLSFIDLVLAFSALDAAAQSGPGTDSSERAWRSGYASLPPEQYPNIAATFDELLPRLSSSSFPLALELFLTALETAPREGRRAGRQDRHGMAHR